LGLRIYASVGLVKTIHIQCIYGREITKYMFIYGVYLRFWPALYMTVYLVISCQ
jgi:hypothetical protein